MKKNNLMILLAMLLCSFLMSTKTFSSEKKEFILEGKKIKIQKTEDHKSLEFFDVSNKNRFLFKIDFSSRPEEVTHVYFWDLNKNKTDYLIVTRAFIEGPEKSHLWKVIENKVSLAGETECEDHQIEKFESSRLLYSCFEVDKKNSLKEVKIKKELVLK
jgi:hypothetical protein